MLTLRTLTENGTTYVLLPQSEYKRLCEELEDAADVASYDAAKARNEEGFPATLWEAIEAGGSAVALLREHRGMTQEQLGNASGVQRAMIAQIEIGKKEGSIKTLKALADALRVPLDMLA